MARSLIKLEATSILKFFLMYSSKKRFFINIRSVVTILSTLMKKSLNLTGFFYFKSFKNLVSKLVFSSVLKTFLKN